MFSRLPGPAVLAMLGLGICVVGCAARKPPRPDPLLPPPAAREFRAAWVATVGNIDWPSKPGLSTAEQQREVVDILDRAGQLNLNAIILQVRTSCDALYPSRYEPWSEFLTGRQGVAPEPLYDPLRFWVEQAHRRGIELHAWFNPYRARSAAAKGPQSSDHVSRSRPDLVRTYGNQLWLDPGEPEAQAHTLRVMLDVVKRYDIDGVHIDDYFYPYPVGGADFPDERSWQRYVAGGGRLGRSDWRRDNINRLIRRLYVAIKRERKRVKFGISPFGIWKPGHPPGVQGFNQHEGLYADAKLWLNKGWCDYFTPQLYWKISAATQPYTDLLRWWVDENTRRRHLWPGNIPSRISNRERGWDAREILDQIAVTRAQPGATGNVHFSMKPLMENRKGISDALREGPYARPALVPASPWLDRRPPQAPEFTLTRRPGQAVRVRWTSGRGERAWLWAVHVKYRDAWRLHVYPRHHRACTLAPDPQLGPVTAVAVRAVDRASNQSARTRARPVNASQR